MPFRFEGLEIWHKAREFSARIYEVTAKFPPHELYGLAGQMNRAANAVSLLMAEGAGLDTNAQFNHRLGHLSQLKDSVNSAQAGTSQSALSSGYEHLD